MRTSRLQHITQANLFFIYLLLVAQQLTHTTASATIMTPTPPPTLYHIPKTISSPIYQVMMELGLVFNSTVRVEVLTFKDIKQPEYLRTNPMGTSPSFVHENHPVQGNIQMFESGAIMSWLLEEYDTDYKFHPGESLYTGGGRIIHAYYLMRNVACEI